MIDNQLMTPDECVKIGGHCWERTGLVMDSLPPQYPEGCRHCSATRIAVPQDPYKYRYAEENPDE